jgi:hypothetical protein
MDSRHHVKTINTDERSKKRIRFASSKERSKKASADVYRSYKGRIGGGVTSAATREEFVHNPKRDEGRAKKKSRHRVDHDSGFIKISNNKDKAETILEENENEEEEEMGTEISSTFSGEIDVAFDRNASEIFSKFHREIWKLVRSLPEILHNLDRIVDILVAYMLSPASMPDVRSPNNKTITSGGDDD